MMQQLAGASRLALYIDIHGHSTKQVCNMGLTFASQIFSDILIPYNFFLFINQNRMSSSMAASPWLGEPLLPRLPSSRRAPLPPPLLFLPLRPLRHRPSPWSRLKAPRRRSTTPVSTTLGTQRTQHWPPRGHPLLLGTWRPLP